MSMYSSPSDDAILIAIDHGYGNIKTPNFCFPAGFAVYGSKPPIASDISLLHIARNTYYKYKAELKTVE